MHMLKVCLFDVIDRAMLKYGCHDWKEKLIGAGCDGASVNLGVNDSVATRLRENRPYVRTVHCVAHRLELGALVAHRLELGALSTLKQNTTLFTA